VLDDFFRDDFRADDFFPDDFRADDFLPDDFFPDRLLAAMRAPRFTGSRRLLQFRSHVTAGGENARWRRGQ
jgi:hypothetical protein